MGAEALARWTCTKYGPVSPASLSPVGAERAHHPLGRWVFREAQHSARHGRKSRPDFKISINLSYLQVVSNSMVPFIN
ncbi:MAG: EAL domain-containing protein [Bilophila wadsworthia]